MAKLRPKSRAEPGPGNSGSAGESASPVPETSPVAKLRPKSRAESELAKEQLCVEAPAAKKMPKDPPRLELPGDSVQLVLKQSPRAEEADSMIRAFTFARLQRPPEKSNVEAKEMWQLKQKLRIRIEVYPVGNAERRPWGVSRACHQRFTHVSPAYHACHQRLTRVLRW